MNQRQFDIDGRREKCKRTYEDTTPSDVYEDSESGDCTRHDFGFEDNPIKRLFESK
jgi:hypothetical protein